MQMDWNGRARPGHFGLDDCIGGSNAARVGTDLAGNELGINSRGDHARVTARASLLRKS
jgi:hypothetical protein